MLSISRLRGCKYKLSSDWILIINNDPYIDKDFMLKLTNSIFGNLIHYNEDKWVLNPTTKCGTIPSNAPKMQKKKKL